MIRDIALPAYLPDQSPISGTLTRAENVYAAVDGYRPVGAPVALSEALEDVFQGGASFISTNGTSYMLAGTADALFDFSGGTWTSITGGLTVGRWRFAQFGDYAIAVTGSVTQEVDLGAGTASALSGAPTGTSIAVVGDFVVIGQADGDLLKVQWSAFNDHTGWTAGVNQSGYQPMLTGGEVMGLGGGEYGVILQRQRIVRMERTGDADTPFTFSEITPNVGCASKGSIAQAGRSIFFLSDRGFMALEDGQALKPIGNEKVDRTFQAAVSRDDYERIFSAVDPQNTLALWLVPGNPGTVWCYNWVLDRWSTFSAAMSGIFPGFTASTTLEALSVTYPDIDAMPYSLDDQRFSGGAPRLYVVDGSQQVCTFTGSALAARIEQGFVSLSGSKRSRIQHLEPIGDMTSGVTVTLDARDRLGDASNLTAGSELRASGTMPLRCSGRYISTRWRIAAGATWSYFQGYRVAFASGGDR